MNNSQSILPNNIGFILWCSHSVAVESNYDNVMTVLVEVQKRWSAEFHKWALLTTQAYGY